MATGTVSLIKQPAIWAQYIRQAVPYFSRMIRSGALTNSPTLATWLSSQGGGTYNLPSWAPLSASDAAQIPTDTSTDQATVYSIGTAQEIAVRLSRTNHYGSTNLAEILAGSDPLAAIRDFLAPKWASDYQAALIAQLTGIFADNTANDSADMTYDASNSGTFVAGQTEMSAVNVMRAKMTMGDAVRDIAGRRSLLFCHSVPYGKMLEGELIDFVKDSQSGDVIETFNGSEVIVDDTMPNASDVYTSYICAPGSILWAAADPRHALEEESRPLDFGGAGQHIIHSRQEISFHVPGTAYGGTRPVGGPNNTASTHMLAAAGSWNRVYGSRKQIKIARLLTTEA